MPGGFHIFNFHRGPFDSCPHFLSVKVREAPVLHEREQDSMSAATPSQPVHSTSDSQQVRGEAAWSNTAAKGVDGSQTRAYTVSVNYVKVPRIGYRLVGSASLDSFGTIVLGVLLEGRLHNSSSCPL